MSQINAVAGFGLATCYGIMAGLSRSETGISFISFAGLMALAFLFYAASYFYAYLRTPVATETVIFWAFVFRLLGFFGEPLFEDDYYRYLWDGFRFTTDGTPYGHAPESYFSDSTVPTAFHAILSQINHPDIPSIYAPTFQYLFRLAYWIAPGQLWSLKLLLIAADLLLVVVLFRFTNSRQVLLYAWNPLVIKEIAFTAHPDGLLPLLFMADWLLCQHGQRVAASLLLALSVASKASAWLLAPFLFMGLGGFGTAAFAAFYSLLYAPFLLYGATDVTGLQVFARDFEFNSALYGL